MFLAEIRIAAKTSSLTAFALAPGALKTGIAIFVIFSIGILLTPDPALPTASKLVEISISCILYDLTKIASGEVTSSPI